MTITRAFAATATLTLSLGALAACGSSSDDPGTKAATSPLTTVSKSVFVEKGNALCRANAEAIASKFMAMSEPPKPAEFTAAYDNMIKESYKVTGDVLGIGAPKGQEQEFLDLLVEMHQVTVGVDAGGQERFFADESDPWAAVTSTLVEDFGLTDCKHEE